MHLNLALLMVKQQLKGCIYDVILPLVLEKRMATDSLPGKAQGQRSLVWRAFFLKGKSSHLLTHPRALSFRVGLILSGKGLFTLLSTMPVTQEPQRHPDHVWPVSFPQESYCFYLRITVASKLPFYQSRFQSLHHALWDLLKKL